MKALALALLAAPALALAQHKLPQPGDSSRNAPGGVRVSMHYHWVDTGRKDYGWTEICYNACGATIHNGHEECGDKCSDGCKTDHSITEDTDFETDQGGLSQLTSAILQASGSSASRGMLRFVLQNWIWKVDYDDDDPRDYIYNYPVAHWCKDDCSWSRREYGYGVDDLVADWTVYSNGQKVSSGSNVVGHYYWPSVIPMYSDGPFLDCTCHPTYTWHNTISDYKIQYGFFEGPHILTTYTYLNNAELNGLGYKLAVHDVDTSTVYIDPMWGPGLGGFTFAMNPGTIYTPIDDLFQRMIQISSVRIPWLTEDQLLAGPFASAPKSADARINCLDMDKQPPNDSEAYTARPCLDDKLRNLAYLASDESIKGPWDQVRFWIYENHATYDQIHKKLLPPPLPGSYLKSAYEVAKYGGANFDDAPLASVLEPKLLSSPCPPKALRWFLHHMAKSRSQEVVSWLHDNASIFSNLLANAKEDDGKMQYVADLASALVLAKQPEYQLAGLQLLLDGVPTDKKADFMKANGTVICEEGLASTNEATVLNAMDVLTAYHETRMNDALSDLAKNGSSDAIKSKAQSTLDGLR